MCWSSGLGQKPTSAPTISPQRRDMYKGEWINWVIGLALGGRASSTGLSRRPEIYVRSLGITSMADYLAWGRSGSKPDDIPLYPDQAHRDRGEGWINWGDWLGIGTRMAAVASIKLESAETIAGDSSP